MEGPLGLAPEQPNHAVLSSLEEVRHGKVYLALSTADGRLHALIPVHA